MNKRERERRRRAKHKWQKAKRRENKIVEAERRLLGNGELPEGWTKTTYAMHGIPIGRMPGI